MSVAGNLGLDQLDVTPAEVVRVWPVWQFFHPELRSIDVRRLREWLQCASVQEADDVLYMLAKRAAMDGGQDRIAAVALAWALLPGAVSLAHRWLRSASDIDLLVAEQLWLKVRSFAWQRRRKVAANILLDVRKGVLTDMGVPDLQPASERANTLSIPIAEFDAIDWGQDDPTPDVRLHDLLCHAEELAIITPADHDLLLTVLEIATEVGAPRGPKRGLGGFASTEFTEVVATRYGVSGRTIRRRLERTMTSLRAALPDLLDDLPSAA